MEQHIKLLKECCRICGKELHKERQNSARSADIYCRKYHKMEFYEDLGELFGMELNFDRDDIHPQFICKKDARVLYRYRQKKSINKHFSTDMVPAMFLEHDDNCQLCFQHVQGNKGGRPIKRKRGAIGKMHKHNEPEQGKGGTADVSQYAECSSSAADFTCEHVHNEQLDQGCILCIVKQFCRLLKVESDEKKMTCFHVLLENLDKDDLQKLAYEMGRKEMLAIRKDAQSFALMYKDLDVISKFDLLSWLKGRNLIVNSFFCGVGNCSKDIETLDNDKLISLACSLEQAYQMTMPKLVSPFAFLQNICLYCVSGSKLVVDITSRTKPSGGYKAIFSWLYEQAAREPKVLDGDVMNVFDNEQVVGRKNSIKPKNKTKVSIITNKGFTQLDASGTLQKEERLKPTQLLKLNEIEVGGTQTSKDRFKSIVEDVIEQSSEIYRQYESVHYEQLHYFVDVTLKLVLEEQKLENGILSDHVDESVAAQKAEKLIRCNSCGMLNSKRKQICVGCKEKDGIRQTKALEKEQVNAPEKKNDPSFLRLEFELENDGNINIRSVNDVQEHERYDHIVSNHQCKKEIILTDPVYCNPNSFETVAFVLRQIGLENGIFRYGGNSRHWTCVCCDGVPYLICTKLKEEAVVCTVDGCRKTFLSKLDYSKHTKEAHLMNDEWGYIHEFDWFYLRIGSGHYEMNLMRSFFEMNWIPFLEKLCEEMGFVSDAAKLFAKNGKDLHKTWQLLLTFHFATLRELVLPCVRHCLQCEKLPNSKEFFSYSHNTYEKCPNHKFIMDQVCRMSQGIINFRMATRRNNAQLLQSAKYMTKELFYARTHPKYQKIELYDHLQYLLMPPEVKNLNDRYVSITTSGNHSSGQDFDFVLEEKNRQLKQWISKGIPTDVMWQKVCRNNVLLERIKCNTYTTLGLPAGDKKLKDIEIEPAITAFRTVLRKANYLGDTHDNTVHVSLNGQELDKELVKYLEKASLKRIYFLKNSILQENIEDLPCMSNPVPVTPDEREKLECINNMTKAQIEKEILKLIEMINEPDILDYHMVHFRQKVKSKKKADYISFYTELKKMLTTAGVTESAAKDSEASSSVGQMSQLASKHVDTDIETADVNEKQYVEALLHDLLE